MRENRMSQDFLRCVYLVPCCDQDIDRLDDLMDSIRYYTRQDYLMICVNDCRDGEAVRAVNERASRDFVPFLPRYGADWPRNTYGALFCKKYQCIEHLVANYGFEYLILLDTDALVTGSGLVDHVERCFAEKGKDMGLIGSYRIRADGAKRTRWQWGLYMLYLAYVAGGIPRDSLFWKNMVPAARKNGYKLGEHVLGGAFVFSRACVKKMLELYPYDVILEDGLYRSRIGDDVIFSLLTFASGFRIGDFGRPADPMALALDTLPLAKEEITKRGKQIIHSVKRGLEGETEDELRRYFKGLRC
jgi:hypothetical protein